MIDLSNLDDLCADLPAESAGPLAHRAAVALERRHKPGVQLSVTGDFTAQEDISWVGLPALVAQNEDQNETTRDGAMGIALALAHRHKKWRVLRRLQSSLSEGADWILQGQSEVYALEVKGTDEGSLPLAEALRQAKASLWVQRNGATPAVCVVSFKEPRAVFQTDEPK